ncbi:ankyrin repeat domain-containing protein, partial [Treponema sp. R6D11]
MPTAYWAVGKKELQFLVPLLVERGAPVDALNISGKTALYCVVETNNLEVASFLLKRGADPNQQGKDGETALMAVRSKEAVDLLISSGANPNLQGKDGETVLMKIRWLKPAVALLQAGADPT